MSNRGKSLVIGQIGMGWIGQAYNKVFKKMGYKVLSYSLEEPWVKNKDKIKECDVVFIAVWTPTTPKGFDSSVLESVLPLVGKGKIAVIKSTMVPGTTKRLQKMFPNIKIIYSPEFLSVATSHHDARKPWSSIVGLPVQTLKYKEAGKLVLSIMPKAPFTLLCDSTQAELIKYSHNISGYANIIIFNLLYNMAQKLDVDWEPIRQAILADPFMAGRYSQPVHKSGRGAGGGCFIKDMAAFRGRYLELLPQDKLAHDVLKSLERENIKLLKASKKDLDLLRGVYGKSV